MKIQFLSSSLAATLEVGKKLGSFSEPGDVICLGGELGSGKTTLAQAIAEGAGVDQRQYVNSPTFAVLHEYGGRIPIYHMDFYRLGSSEDVLPESVVVVHLSFVNTNSRAISLHSNDYRWQKIIGDLKTTLNLS